MAAFRKGEKEALPECYWMLSGSAGRRQVYFSSRASNGWIILVSAWPAGLSCLVLMKA